MPASCREALGASQWTFKLGPLNDENGCRIKAAEYERKTNELISTITSEVPPSPAAVELLARRVAAKTNNRRLEVPEGIAGESALLLNKAKRSAIAQHLKDDTQVAPIEAAPTTVELTKDEDGGVRLVTLVPQAKHLLTRFELTEAQLQQIEEASAGETLTMEVGQIAGPIEEAPSGLLTSDEELALELKKTKARLINEGQYVDGDLLRRATALIAHLQGEHEEKRLSVNRDGFEMALEPEKVPAVKRKLEDLPRMYVEAKKGAYDTKHKAMEHFIEVTRKQHLDQTSINDRGKLISDHQQNGREKRGKKAWKDSTFQTNMRHLNSLFNWAVDMQYIEKNPVQGWSNVWAPERSETDEEDDSKGFTVDQIRKIDKIITNGIFDNSEDLHLWIFQRCFGGRISELAGLRHCDFREFKGRKCIFVVKHSLRSLKNGKTKKILPVPACIEWLWDAYASNDESVIWPKFMTQRKDKMGKTKTEWATTFAGNLGRWMRKYAQDNQLDGEFPNEYWTTKVFRRSIGSILRDLTGEDHVSRDHLNLLRGHADGSIARIYDDAEVGQVARAAEIYARVTGFDKIALALGESECLNNVCPPLVSHCKGSQGT